MEDVQNSRNKKFIIGIVTIAIIVIAINIVVAFY